MNFKSNQITKVLRDVNDKNHNNVRECLLSICIGNELIVEKSKNEKNKERLNFEYNGASTDELALVYFA